MVLIYSLAIAVYHGALHVASLFHPKAKAWVAGRQHWRRSLRQWRATLPADTTIYWMHCASLGEFEQGRPVLEGLKQARPDVKLVLTFYSPSGYEQRKDYEHADYVCYLPPDSAKNAREWVAILCPSTAIFVKYEFWAFHLRELFQNNIPTYLIAASFRPQQVFFRWYGIFFRRLLNGFKTIFVQTVSDQELLLQHDCLPTEQIVVAGDPRVDRVLTIAQQAIDFPKIKEFKAGYQLFVAGSSWPPGEDMLLTKQTTWWTKDWKLLLAPHDISDPHIQAILDKTQIPTARYSEWTTDSDLALARILILDTIGMLSRVYSYSDLVYIGGGFGTSIHNTLEPAAFHLPLIFGPKYHKFPEAVRMVEQGGAFALNSPDDFATTLERLQDEDVYQNARSAVRRYVQANAGATTKILSRLLAY